ncbi:MAG TPA: hypothetical protein VJ933_11250, partial [Phaeodactylibacter sp.]|nr:hypothetical protein [Phaeodactylibacter sp.]
MLYRILLAGLLLLGFACSGGDSSSNTAQTEDREPTVDTAAPQMELAAPKTTEEVVAAKPPFEQELSEGDIRFTITSPNAPKENTLAIQSEGLSGRNPSFTKDLGTQQVYRAELADLNQDGYPEVYIFTRTTTAPPQGEVYAFASYRNRSYGEVYVADEAAQNLRSSTYQGGDVFELKETALVRRFPVYENGRASADSSTLTYKLKMGETSYRLEV